MSKAKAELEYGENPAAAPFDILARAADLGEKATLTFGPAGVLAVFEVRVLTPDAADCSA